MKKIALAVLEVVFTVIMIIGLSFSTPTVYRAFLRKTVSSKVVRLEIFSKNTSLGGGTGFYIKGPSGKTYILTNRHVCYTEKGQVLKLVKKDKKPVDAKIIEVSNKSDLCLVASDSNTDGLSIADKVYQGDKIYYVGYPRLQPLTMSEGEMVGYEAISIRREDISQRFTKEECLKNKDASIIKMPVRYHEESLSEDDFSKEQITQNENTPNHKTKEICIETAMSMITTAMTYGGASGSPVVNSFGKLVGVIYAAPSVGGWGSAVPLSSINEFLLKR